MSLINRAVMRMMHLSTCHMWSTNFLQISFFTDNIQFTCTPQQPAYPHHLILSIRFLSSTILGTWSGPEVRISLKMIWFFWLLSNTNAPTIYTNIQISKVYLCIPRHGSPRHLILSTIWSGPEVGISLLDLCPEFGNEVLK